MKALTHLIQQDQPYEWAFKVGLDGLAPNSLRVLKFKVTEAPSTLYQGVIQVASRNTKIDPILCIDRQVILSVHHKYDAHIRYFVGTLKCMTANDIVNGWAYYTLEMQPALFHLDLTSNARIFQQKTVQEIVKTILNEHGIVDYEFRVRDAHLPREYCVQYHETNLAFIERLLAEEGFFYFWEHSKRGAKLIVADHSLLGSLMASPNVEYNPDPSVALKGQFMLALNRTESIGTTDLKQRDYCFKNPRYTQEHSLYQERLGGEPNIYEQYAPYGRYKDDNSGKRFTQYQLEAQRHAITQVTGLSNVPHLSAGYHVNLQRHPNPSRNQSYQVLKIIHTGTQPQATEARNDTQSADTRYGNELTLFPLNVHSWRAPIPVKPVLNGPQIAHVVGPKDEEIFCDEHGRVKVQFPWDLEGQYNDKSSCWIRVSQGSAGAGWGAMSIPRVGQEVIVKFLEGDPDQPIIMGRTYDAVNKPPYALPQHKTRMSIKSKTHKGTGFNELRFEDKQGQEEVYIHAEKDFKRFIKNNEVVSIEGELKVNVIQASEQQAKSVQITANDFIEFTLGGNHIKMTPSQIIISGKNVALKGQAMTVIKGGVVKINAGGGGGAQAKANLKKMSVAPEVEEFGGFGKQAVDSGKGAEEGGFDSKDATSLALDAMPIVGVVKGIVQTALGQDIITGDTLDRTSEALATVAGFVPGGKLAAKGGMKMMGDVGKKKIATPKPSPAEIKLAKSSGKTTAHVAARDKVARNYLENNNFSEGQIRDALGSPNKNKKGGVDLYEPLEIMKFPPPEKMYQYVKPHGNPGNWFDPIGNQTSDSLGINGATRSIKEFKVPKGDGLLSRSRAVIDDWTVSGKSVQTTGGGVQLFVNNQIKNGVM